LPLQRVLIAIGKLPGKLERVASAPELSFVISLPVRFEGERRGRQRVLIVRGRQV
jgi:hypothetical protein